MMLNVRNTEVSPLRNKTSFDKKRFTGITERKQLIVIVIIGQRLFCTEVQYAR